VSEIATIDKIVRMMTYLNIEYYIVPHYHLEAPEILRNEKFFRSEKIYTLYRTGYMSYKGYPCGVAKPEVYMSGLTPPQPFLTRVYLHLMTDVNTKLKWKTQGSLMPNVRDLMVKFNGLEFVDGFVG
jgi:hypothetical protein